MKLLSPLLCAVVIPHCILQSSLAAVSSADISILGFYTDGSPATGDAVAWLAINHISAGETLYFSDSSYFTATGSFLTSGEGLVRFISPTGGVAAGTVMSFSSGSLGANYSQLANTAYSGGGNPPFQPSASGDQLVIFQDNVVNDSAGFNALWAINNASNTWDATGISSSDANQSNLYPGLTDGVNALALGSGAGPEDEWDNTRYTGPTSGTANQIRESIANIANWERTNTPNANPTNWVTHGISTFTIIPEPSSALLIFYASLTLTLRRQRS